MVRMKLKNEIATTVETDDSGYLRISQPGAEVKLSCRQVELVVDFLRDGNGLAMREDWSNGIAEDR